MIQKIALRVTFLVLIGFVSTTSLAAQSIKHTVQDEETLFGIAQKYGVTVQQLQKWNNISGSAISIGQVLIIKQQGEGSENGSYTVKDGDTLFSIAHQFGVTVDELKKWNNLATTTISIGQKLRIRPVKEHQPEETVEPVEKTNPLPVVKGAADGYYTVKSGDTLFRIAQMFGMEVEQLKKLNNLTTNNISVGQELKIAVGSAKPVTPAAGEGAVIRYTLKQGMELQEFLRVFEMSKEKFTQLNPAMKATYLNKGQVVRVVVPKTEYEPIASTTAGGLTVLGEMEAEKYSAQKKGTVTTNGELYNPQALTAAHAAMAIGSVVFVKNPVNGKGVIVRINDRITQKGVLKLSKAAWQTLGLTSGSKVILYRINEED